MRAPSVSGAGVRRWLPLLAVTAVVLAALVFTGASASDETAPDLRREIERQYRVEAAPGGLLLRARSERYGVETIAVVDDRVSINGARVGPDVVSAWLGDDAGPVLRLLDLSPAERRSLFGLDLHGLAPVPSPPTPPEPPSALSQAPEGAAPEVPSPPPAPEVEAEAPPAPDVERTRTGSQFTLFNDIVVEADQSAREAVAVFGSVTVLGEVRGDVTAVFGTVTVDGRVGGNVIAVQGEVHLGPNAAVEQDVTSVGRGVERAEGARVQGAVRDLPFATVPWSASGRRHGWSLLSPLGGLWSLFWRLTLLAALAVFLGATYLVAPTAVERVAGEIRRRSLHAFLIGLLVVVLFLPFLGLLLLALVITILGIALIPLILLGLPFLIVGVTLVGYAGLSLTLGRWLGPRLGWGSDSPYAALLLGLVTLEGLRFAGSIGVAAGGLAAGLGWLLLSVGFLVRLGALSTAVGGVVLARYGHRLSGGAAEGPASAA